MIRAGVVGFGKMGLLHAGILNSLPGCKVVAVTEKEKLLNKLVSKFIPDVAFYTNVCEMIEKNDLDCIHVTTPISTHAPIIRDVFSTKDDIAIFVEKPLATDYPEAKQLVDMVSRLGVKSMVGFQKRFSPGFMRAKSLLEQGAIGQPISFNACYYYSSTFHSAKGWRQRKGEGGVLLDLGPHLLDLLVWYFGKPLALIGHAWPVRSVGVDDVASGSLQFESGLAGKFEISWCVEGYRLPEMSLLIEGTNGRLRVTDDYLKLRLDTTIFGMPAGDHLFRKPDLYNGVDFLIGEPEYCLEDKHFLDSLLKGKMPEPDFRAGMIVNDLIDDFVRGHPL